ncbi:hypothetical protein ASQ44_03255 [Rickettsia rhipicephali]|uniref:Uncharacterized protein n=1 Tax=Rickettsia rhipicephali (strain 3-7-female6-CWPP) TaxID=1105113 RepID=A0AAI8AA86_RICR3|nr:hypothetical protein [Rickettsia rhipicephali]AFC72532.1 hypothetical protein MCC_05025 [Rickettsia rhipicephali str. 3-7-female6-CWPP]ALN41177.1 hypothetical protein ASQ44_03255 [Rickettsia rhipicephali]
MDNEIVFYENPNGNCFLGNTKGRITLGKLAKGVSSFHVIVNSKKGQIILEPYTEIPLKESWLFNYKKALTQLNNGIKDSAKGQVKFIEDFSKYLDDDF